MTIELHGCGLKGCRLPIDTSGTGQRSTMITDHWAAQA